MLVWLIVEELGRGIIAGSPMGFLEISWKDLPYHLPFKLDITDFFF